MHYLRLVCIQYGTAQRISQHVVDSTLTGATDVVQYLHVSVYHVKYYLAVQSLALRARSVRAMLSLSDRITEASEASGRIALMSIFYTPMGVIFVILI